jgi:alkylation response protein AidB-like acyl-CoA dehydrogenase
MTHQKWIDRANTLGPELAEYTQRHDEDGSFVDEAYGTLRDEGLFKALVPEALGGGGASYSDICHFIRQLAHYDGSAALSFSMHTHLVAATLFKVRKGQPGEALLRKVAADDLILVSTGAGDWLESNGTLSRVPGGYRYTSEKPFASGSPRAQVMITSGRYDDPDEGPLVLHFPLSLSAEGVTRGTDWDTHGMRGTGSNTVSVKDAFIPDEAIALRRARGPWHPAFDVIATVALPIITSVYVGLAERAYEIALELSQKRREDRNVQLLAGELRTLLFTVRALWQAHVDNATDLEFSPDRERTLSSVEAKTAIAETVERTVSKAMELAGGAGFFRARGLERILRDVRAVHYHPLQAKQQHALSGRGCLGLDLV